MQRILVLTDMFQMQDMFLLASAAQQGGRVHRSLDIESPTLLSHRAWTIVTLFCPPRRRRSWTRTACSNMVTGTGKYERGLSRLMLDDLDVPWLVLRQRVQYKLAVTVHRCLRHRAPWYLVNYCVTVSQVPGRQHLRSASRHQLSVPRVRRSTFETRAFSVAGPTVWNSLSDHLCDPFATRNNLGGT